MNKRLNKSFIILSAIIIAIMVIFATVVRSILHSWGVAGTFGDTFGALNTLFSGLAFAGVLITIWLQQAEIKDARKEAHIDRITDIIYHQFDRIEKAIEEFEVTETNNVLQKSIGHKGFLYLKDKINKFYPIKYEALPGKEVIEVRKKINASNIQMFVANQDQINMLAIRCYNATGIVKQTLLNSELSINDINQLRQLLFDNIGFIHLQVLEDIEDSIKEYFELFQMDNNYLLEIGSLNRSQIFIKSILRFKDANFTPANFEQLKQELLQ